MSYTYSVKIEPMFLIAAPIAAALLFHWSGRKTAVEENSIVSRFRPLIALYIDSVFISTVFAPLFLIPLMLEYIGTGSWAWSVNRNFFKPTDVILVVEILLIFVAFHYYLKWVLRRERQTVGQYFMRFQLTNTKTTGQIGLMQYLSWALAFGLPKLTLRYSWGQSAVTKSIKAQKVKPLKS